MKVIIMTDTLIQNFSVSEYIYARDNGDNASSFGRYTLNGDGSRQYGNVLIYTLQVHYIASNLDLTREQQLMHLDQYVLILLIDKRRS